MPIVLIVLPEFRLPFMMVVVIAGLWVDMYSVLSNVKEKKQVNELHVALSNANRLKDAVCDDRYSTFAQTSARHIPYITLNVPTYTK